MHLERLFTTQHPITGLIQKSRYHRQLNDYVKTLLPKNIAAHVHVTHINEQGQLMLMVSNNTAATRLRMIMPTVLANIQRINSHITGCHVSLRPQPAPQTRQKRLHMPKEAAQCFANTAQQLASRHPQLAEAMMRLARKHNTD